jgi:hypothetical protein
MKLLTTPNGRPVSFRKWILQHVNENTAFGDLARDIKEDGIWQEYGELPKTSRFEDWMEHIADRACDAAVDCLENAFVQYEIYRSIVIGAKKYKDESTFGNRDETFDLMCPECGSDYIHIDEVHVAAQPNGEDTPTKKMVLSLTSNDESTSCKPFVEQSTRRHYVSLVGWCENCGDNVALSFVQHKGRTTVQTSVFRQNLAIR